MIDRFSDDLRAGLIFARSNPPVTTWKAFFTPRNKHPLVQFIKYGLCGVLSTVVYNVLFAVTGYTVFPHFEHLVESLGLTMNQRIINFSLSSLAGFIVSNLVAYLSNLYCVFEGGRHARAMEFLIFTIVSSVGFIVGLGMAILNLTKGTGGSWMAAVTLLVTSIIVNFLCRKFVVFKS